MPGDEQQPEDEVEDEEWFYMPSLADMSQVADTAFSSDLPSPTQAASPVISYPRASPTFLNHALAAPRQPPTCFLPPAPTPSRSLCISSESLARKVTVLVPFCM